MQTFLPYPDLRASCLVLDDRRLGKQRVETFQILRALTWPDYAWKNHPAVRMWRGFVPALVGYGLENCREWTRRGYADAVAPQLLAWSGGTEPVAPSLPPWFGLEALHLSHRSSLLRKDPDARRTRHRESHAVGQPDTSPPVATRAPGCSTTSASRRRVRPDSPHPLISRERATASGQRACACRAAYVRSASSMLARLFRSTPARAAAFCISGLLRSGARNGFGRIVRSFSACGRCCAAS